MNNDGAAPGFYCVHALGGEVANFRHLAEKMKGVRKFYGIQTPPEMMTPEFASSIEAMAAHYVKDLLAFQPEGPILLGGWSSGSTIALEMARLLKEAGRMVELIVALDSERHLILARARPDRVLSFTGSCSGQSAALGGGRSAGGLLDAKAVSRSAE